ncbi:MAG: hypothetical protein IPI59_15425 [Sphingobacteriales bacterium]|jgi:TolA-binding protein|nr:hypothetical protein [Sphingobacteriales bacterium]MBP9141709.1 hypothetical protein [Chitinophagales bacterium]MDA0198504.1 hypothetical protein [Bacteroidota bacterium]MBK6888605.1 hypothetical protein [Sphingobacteriales bacterium]MBK7528887.1 hypothetical protein [Sphingobacteriales bacterium]
MITEDNKLNLIRQYANGELDQTQLAEFNLALQNDAEFKEEVELHLTIMADQKIKESQRLKKIAETEGLKPEFVAEAAGQPAISNTQAPSAAKGQATRIIAMRIAALFVLIAAVWLLWPSGGQNEKAIALAQTEIKTPYPLPGELSTMGDFNGEDTERNAYDAYKNGNYEKAISGFVTLTNIQNLPPDKMSQFNLYLGLSYMYLQSNPKYEMAIIAFEKMTDPATIEAKNWFTALALIELKRPKEAKPLLKKMESEQRKTKAAEILKYL